MTVNEKTVAEIMNPDVFDVNKKIDMDTAIPQTMKALVAYGVGDYRFESAYPVPECGEEDIIIKVEACGICAGDIKASHKTARFWGGDGMPGFCKPPFIPGHEFLGYVVKIGAKAAGDFKIGDRIISEQIVPCGECYYCKRGMYWLCDPHDVYGFKNYLNGGMAEYARLPKGSINYHVPESFSLEEGALIEPFACALHGVEQGHIGPEDTVVVAGAGTLSLGMINFIREMPHKKLIALGRNDMRLGVAKEVGAEEIINVTKEDAVAKVLAETDGVGCDVYIEATGNPDAVQQGLDMVRKGGTFVEFSVMSGTTTVDWSIIGDTKEISVQGSQLSPHCYEKVINSIREGRVIVDHIITHKFKLEDWEEAYRTAQTKQALKVIFVP